MKNCNFLSQNSRQPLFFSLLLQESNKNISPRFIYLFISNFDLSIIDLLNDIRRMFTIDGAANRVSSTQHFLNGTSHRFSHGSVSHSFGGVQNIVKRDITIVFDVLDLLSVSDGFFQGYRKTVILRLKFQI